MTNSVGKGSLEFAQKKGYLSAIIAFFSFLLVQLAWDNYGIWSDELFTLNLIRQPYLQTITATAQDVHPPLYYLCVKLFTQIFSIFHVDTIIASKLFSVTCLVLLMILTTRKLLKRYGYNTALMFLILFFGTRVIMYAVEIRMYALAMLFVTMSFLYANEIRYEDSRHNWICFTVYSILAAYTHYHAAISVSLFYFYLLYWTVKNGTWKKWLISFAVIVFSYLPWLFVILAQLKHVNEGWGGNLTFRDFAMFVAFPFYTNNVPLTAVIGLLCVCLVIADWRKGKDVLIKLGEFSPVYVGAIGLVAAVLAHKFFTGKYMLPVWVVFWVSLAVAYSKSKYRKQILAIFLLLNTVTYAISWQKEDADRKGYYVIRNLVETNAGTAFHCDSTIASIIDYYGFAQNNGQVDSNLDENDTSGYYIVYTDLSYSSDLSKLKTVQTIMLGGASVTILHG